MRKSWSLFQQWLAFQEQNCWQSVDANMTVIAAVSTIAHEVHLNDYCTLGMHCIGRALALLDGLQETSEVWEVLGVSVSCKKVLILQSSAIWP